MHHEVRKFLKQVRSAYPGNFILSKVLECGSLNINGSCREYFWFCKYFGIDIGHGRGVDMVCPATHYKVPEYYDTVISTEMLEHDKYWKESIRQMYTNCKPGGLIIITCAGPSRPEHGTRKTTPQDSPFTTEYYQNISEGMFASVYRPDMFDGYCLFYERGYQDLMFYGVKKDYVGFKGYEG